MNKRIFLFSIILLVLISLPIFVFLQTKPRTGAVLGSSINNFYMKKAISTVQPPQRKDSTKDPLIYADYAVLLEDSSKYPLYQKQSNAVVPVASMTKVMTAVVAMELYKAADVLTVSEEASKITGSKIDLQNGEKLVFDDILFGLLMNSGNDAAEVLASCKTTREEFVALMNEKAHEIGMKDTEFKDPAGLDDSGHSTAFDMAILFSHAIKNQQFRNIVGTAEKEIFSIDRTISHQLKNTNRLITKEIPFEGVIGGKTGYTLEAGHALVCAAENNGVTLISVVIKTHSSSNSASAQETNKLLSWGFESYSFFSN